jgi:predicted dehydrogenase
VTADGTTENVPLPNVKNIGEELRAFAAAVRKGEPHRNTPQAALQDLIVIEAMLGSADSGASVPVERV